METSRGPWIVAGMHRSGTSLIASSLVGAGLDLGGKLLSGDGHNAPGYFEDLDFLDLDRRMLVSACPGGEGGHPDWGWTEGERFDPKALGGYREEARALLATRGANQRPWGFKDPRATLLLDFWLSLAPHARFVLVYRLPWEVADSMQRLGAEVFLRRPDFGYRIWSFYNRRLLDFHRRHPERTVLISVDAAVSCSHRFGKVLCDRLGLDVPRDALDAQLDLGLLHRISPDDPLIPLAGATYPECVELLAALDARADIPGSELWHRDPPRPAKAAEEPRVAVVIPCLDHGEFLVEAVASVERSIDLPYELMVIDDGSEEPRTRTILATLRDAGYDVRRRPNGGVAAARNSGFASVRAPVVIPLDADNRLLPDFVRPAVATLAQSPELAAVYGDRVEFGLRSGRIEVGPFDPELLVCDNYVDACAVIRRQAWEDCGGYDERMPCQGYEDWELWIRVIARGWSLRWLPLPSFVYRVRPDSMISRLETSAAFPEVQGYLLAKHHDLYLGALRRATRELRETRRELDGIRGELAESVAALAERTAALAESSAAHAQDRGRLEAAEASYRQAAGRARQLEEDVDRERARQDRQRRRLHGWIELWRDRPDALPSTRALRLRDHLVRVRRRMELRPRTSAGEPCVVGATGGSGTRIFARIAERCGLFIGCERNEFEDSLPIERFLDRWVVPFWTGGGHDPPHLSPVGMDQDFLAALDEHLVGYEPGSGLPRGWKAPRSLYVLPFLAQRYPDLRFLHVVRDGRDMAFSDNQLQLARYGSLLLPPAQQEWSEPERSIALWSRINSLTADHGERLRGRYLRVRFEDLCTRPVRIARRVARFFGLGGDPRSAAELVDRPASLGRWRRADPAQVARLEEIGGGALRRFGYRAADPEAGRKAGSG